MQSMSFFAIISYVLCVTANFILPNSDEIKISPRIVGGTEAEEGQFPYQVTIRDTFSREHYCGGAILNSRFILTAAHCPNNVTMYAVVGVIDQNANGTAYDIEDVTRYPLFNMSIFLHDISVMRIAKAIVFTEFVQPIALPTQDTGDSVPVVSTGWGQILHPGDGLSNTLQFMELYTIDLESCLEIYAEKNISDFLPETIICAQSPFAAGNCMGDSGGPLADVSDPDNKVLVGIVSWGIPCAKGYPDVFTRVFSHLDWLKSEMNKQVPGLIN